MPDYAQVSWNLVLSFESDHTAENITLFLFVSHFSLTLLFRILLVNSHIVLTSIISYSFSNSLSPVLSHILPNSYFKFIITMFSSSFILSHLICHSHELTFITFFE